MEFQSIFPTVDDVVALEPKVLGIRMLSVLRDWPEGHMFAIGELLERVAGDRPNAFALASYPADRRKQVRDALEDAWRWLEREGVIEPNTAGGSPSRLSRRALNFEVPMTSPITDADIRGRLLKHFYELRNNSDGWVPTSEIILSPEQVSREAIANVCQQLAEAGYIQWNPFNPQIGQLAIGRGKITGTGVDVVTGARAPAIDIRVPRAGRSPSRQIVIAATDIFKTLGHTGFDRLLLELGLSGKVAGRDNNGLLARATSLSNFVFENSAFRTPEGNLLAEAIVDRAAQIFRDTGARTATETERRTFMTLAKREGLDLEDGSGAMGDDNERVRGPLSPAPFSPLAPASSPLAPLSTAPQGSRKVFIVHGRDESAKNEVELFLRAIDLEPIILHKRPNRGRHILTKFKEEAEGAIFAVVLMTPDDEGGLAGGERQTRARQNVVFELGFFIGVLATTHVAALIKTGVERPSDFDGIGYIDFDVAGNWKKSLAIEMKEAGVPFDASAVLSA